MTQSKAQAKALADRIREFWATRGAPVAVRVEPVRVMASGTDKRVHFVVRSDMVGGQPSNIARYFQ